MTEDRQCRDTDLTLFAFDKTIGFDLTFQAFMRDALVGAKPSAV